jgi:hypothetical protein
VKSLTGTGGPRVLEYRVTKYDPAFRDSSGAYTRDEWTAFSDIGRSFGGAVLTREEYQRVEDAYVAAALGFLRESGVPSLAVTELESHAGHALAFGEGSILGLEQLEEVIRRALRKELWCRLERPEGFVHIGWDYYMYIGVPHPCPEAEKLAHRLGLFVEEFHSPYNQESESTA